MNSQLVIADAGPLIALARIEQLGLLRLLFDDVVMTETVRQEVLPPEDFIEKAGIRQAITAGWLTVVTDDNPEQYTAETLGYVDGLDPGETSSILCAEKLQSGRQTVVLLMDEAKGRAVARRLALEVTGTVGIIALAKRAGLIPEARPLFERLRASGYFLSDAIIKHGLRLAGEGV